MKRKILTILISMLFISLIPSVIGVNSELEKEPCLDVGRTLLWGIILNKNLTDNGLSGYAIWLRYIRYTPDEWDTRVYVFERVNFTFRDSAYMGRMYETGFGLFKYIFFLCMNGLEIAP